MEHQQDKNAFAYVIYERATNQPGDTEPKWIRSLMFYADAPEYSDRDGVWNHYVAWRDPKNIRVVPLYDEDGNDARRDANLDAIRDQYDVDVANQRRRATDRKSLADAVEWALEVAPPHLDEFEGLIRTLEAFDSQVTDQLQVPPHTVTRRDYLPSVEQLAAIDKAQAESDAFDHDPNEEPPNHW